MVRLLPAPRSPSRPCAALRCRAPMISVLLLSACSGASGRFGFRVSARATGCIGCLHALPLSAHLLLFASPAEAEGPGLLWRPNGGYGPMPGLTFLLSRV